MVRGYPQELRKKWRPWVSGSKCREEVLRTESMYIFLIRGCFDVLQMSFSYFRSFSVLGGPCNISSKNQSWVSCMALEPPILLIGDSRIRMFSWVVHDMYISIENVYSKCIQWSKQNIHVEHPDLIPRKPTDAWYYDRHNKYHNYRHKNKYGETILSMLRDK